MLEVVGLDVAENEVAPLQLALDGGDRAREARIVGGDKADLGGIRRRLASSASLSTAPTKLFFSG